MSTAALRVFCLIVKLQIEPRLGANSAQMIRQ